MNHTGWYNDTSRDKVYTKALYDIGRQYHLTPSDEEPVAADVARELKCDINDLNAIQGRMHQFIHRCMMRLRKGNKIYVPVEVQQMGRKCYKAQGVDWQVFMVSERHDILVDLMKKRKQAAKVHLHAMQLDKHYALTGIKPQTKLERVESELATYQTKLARATSELPRVTENFHMLNAAFIYDGVKGNRIDMGGLSAELIQEVEDTHKAHSRDDIQKRTKWDSVREVFSYYADYKDQFEAEVRELPDIIANIEQELDKLRLTQAYELPSSDK